MKGNDSKIVVHHVLFLFCEHIGRIITNTDKQLWLDSPSCSSSRGGFFSAVNGLGRGFGSCEESLQVELTPQVPSDTSLKECKSYKVFFATLQNANWL